MISCLFRANLNINADECPHFCRAQHKRNSDYLCTFKIHVLISSASICEPLSVSWSRILTSVSGAVMVVAAIITNNAAAAAASLGDFDNLQSDQLDLGAAILQNLLSCGQHPDPG